MTRKPPKFDPVELTQPLGDDPATAATVLTGPNTVYAAAMSETVASATDPGSPPSEFAGGGDGYVEDPEEANYELLGVLGTGAMGEVHLARDVVLRRKVALKSILPNMQQPVLFSRFLAEMQITAQLEHPFIVPIYGVESGPGGGLAYTMKMVPGREFDELLSETKEQLEAGQGIDEEHSLEARLEAFLKICDAMAYAHEKGIVHRDLKPANIMLGTFNEVYVMDWGIARPMGAGGKAADAGLEMFDEEGEDSLNADRTRLGSALGTPIYMSPEQAAGNNDELDGRSDLYTLGLILQQVITLTRAVGGTTVQEVFTNAKEGKRVKPLAHIADGPIPRELKAIIEKATRFHPSERYPGVVEFADEIRRYLRNEEVQVLPDDGLRKAARWVSKNRMKAVTMMLVFLLVGAGTAIGTLLYSRAMAAERHTHELRLAQFQTVSALRAHKVDETLTGYESALSQLLGAAQVVLSRAPTRERPVHDPESFAKGQPAALVDSSYYKAKVSIESPLFVLHQVDAQSASAQIQALAGLSGALRETMVSSSDKNPHKLSAKDKLQLITSNGVPIRRVLFALDSGVHLAFPGAATFPKRFDPRQKGATKLAKSEHGIAWGEPFQDGGTMVLPCSVSVYDEKGFLHGVVGLEVTLDHIVGELLDSSEDLDYVAAAALVSRSGRVMASKSRAGGGDFAPAGADGMFSISQVVDAIKAGKSGFMEIADKGKTVLVTYYPVDTLDWYYVGVANVAQMLEKPDPAPNEQQISVPRLRPEPKAISQPKPRASAAPVPTAEPDAGAEDAGAEDAGTDDAATPTTVAPSSTVPIPPPGGWQAPAVAPKGTVPPALTAPPPSPPPAAAPAPPESKPPPPPQKSPFGKWEAYEKKDKPK